MSRHHSEQISGLVDGELHGLRRWRAQRHAARCPLCAAEFRRQQHVRNLLAGNPPPVEMSDSPEFFWSKVRAEIERRGHERPQQPAHRLSLADWAQPRETALAAAVAVLLFAVGVVWWLQVRHAPSVAQGQQPALATVGDVLTPIPDTVATVLKTEDGVVVVWLSGVPWTENMTEMKTLFAGLDT